MRELSLDQLRTLVAITDLGTFSAAAQALHLAQPTVSLHVSELEARLGAPLILRGARKAQPTAAGAVLVQRARRLLRDADDAVDAVQRHVEGRVGRVRLGSSTGVLVYLLPQVLKAMERTHPEIDVEVSILGSSDAMEKLAQGLLDVGLVASLQPPRAGIVLSHWRSDPMMAFVPSQWTVPKRITPQWLAARPLIFNDATTQLYRQTMEWFASAGLTPRARVELNYNEAMKSLVAAGYGATVLPLEHSNEASVHQGLKVVPLKPALTRHTAVVHRPLEAVDGATRNLLLTLAQFRQA
ncbi:MAG TPA: LysR family transcriptional regulator [Polaromonas sp.]|uniref:LysR family transcriptional regulator n=1 Tax=Polaromonas sp. TaxID=1869339 RepID=UPI002D5A4A2E|nr:LysR family transcriptional regulator [Polaromonas sp.]HYW57517.1 LysR family transcriptional regulator [Polaromonas sp.]